MLFLQQPRGARLSLAQIVFVVAPGFILYGYNQSSIGGLLSLPSWTETFPEIDTTHTQGATKSRNATLQGLVVATFVMGALVGCMACMYLGDILGRRKCIFIAAVLTLIGEIICMSSVGLGQLIFGRITIGCAIGIISSTIPVWQAECSPPAHRGKHVVLDGVFTCLGFALASWVNLGSSQADVSNPSITWRLPLAVPIIFSALLMPGIYLMPESPRWLVKVGRFEQASEVLSLLKDLPVSDPNIIAEVADMRKALESDTTKKATLRDMFTMGTDKLFYRFCLCILLQFYQQMSGSNLISVYAPVIFEQNLKLTSKKARLFAGGTLTWKFLSSFVAFFTIDRFGRKALFMFSGLGMGTCMLILAITTGYSSENALASYISVVVIFLYNFFVPIGFLGANFLYCAEVAPVSLRVGMSAISTANHWLWNFVVVMSTPVAIASIGHWYFIIYATIGLSIPVVVWMWFPETMGQTLEEIDQVFRLNEGFRNIVNASVKGSRGNKQTPGIEEAIKEKVNVSRQDLL